MNSWNESLPWSVIVACPVEGDAAVLGLPLDREVVEPDVNKIHRTLHYSDYIKYLSPWLDLLILFRTVETMLAEGGSRQGERIT